MGNCAVAIKKLPTPQATPAGLAVVVDITLSSSYATGGDTVPLAALGLPNGVDMLILTGGAPGGRALEVVHGATPSVAPKIKAYQDNAVAAAAALGEVAAATNLSTITVRGIAYSLPNP